MTQVVSPLPGVFYRRPAPDKPPFVETGDRIETGQTVGIVEIMKQFTEIPAPASGVVGAFAVPDLGMVAPGDVIVTIAED